MECEGLFFQKNLCRESVKTRLTEEKRKIIFK